MVVLGLLFVLMGSVFALQGAGKLGGSSFMDNNPSYIYIGAFVALLGIVLLALGARSTTARLEGPPRRPADEQAGHLALLLPNKQLLIGAVSSGKIDTS